MVLIRCLTGYLRPLTAVHHALYRGAEIWWAVQTLGGQTGAGRLLHYLTDPLVEDSSMARLCGEPDSRAHCTSERLRPGPRPRAWAPEHAVVGYTQWSGAGPARGGVLGQLVTAEGRLRKGEGDAAWGRTTQ